MEIFSHLLRVIIFSITTIMIVREIRQYLQINYQLDKIIFQSQICDEIPYLGNQNFI